MARTQIEQEIKGYAHNIHDEITGGITGIIIQLRNIQQSLTSSEDAQLLADINKVIETANGTLEASRRISNNLRPSLLDRFGIEAAIEQLLRDFQSRYKVSTSFRASSGGLVNKNGKQLLSDYQCIEIFRITQEVLNNIMKHANASYVSCAIEHDEQSVTFVFKDDGSGFSWDSVSGTGISGIKVRALAASGSVVIMPMHPRGTMVKLRVGF